MDRAQEIWTIGHSQRSLAEFLELLQASQIGAVADVRRFAVSSRFPHFSEMELFKALSKAGLEYQGFPDLGGRRRPGPDSPNGRWRNQSFRGYADYMMTQPFHDAVERLLELARQRRTALMCAEALWWRCHRALIADYLKALGLKVTHIIDRTHTQQHPYTSAARIVEGRLTYASEKAQELALL